MVERIMKISSKDKMFDKGATMQKLLVVPALGLLLAGCNPADGTATGVASNDGFSLYCPNVGIAADQCVLSDPENPYASQTVNDSTKYTLAAAATNERAKFYLWATAQAKSQSGENQYKTALSLHELFDDNANAYAKAQAKAAYESVLDNYYSSTSSIDVTTDLSEGSGKDFEFATWGGSSTLDTTFTGDSTYSPVVKVTSGKASWDGSTDIGVVSMFGLTAGTVDKYTHLNFKVKDVDGSTINIKVTDPNGAEHGAKVDVAFALSAVATDIGSTGWKQVSIPLTDNNFKFLATTKEVSIHTGSGVADTYMVTDINFSGDDTGSGLVGDTAPDGFVSIYNPAAASTDFKYGTGTGYEYQVDVWGTPTTLKHDQTGDSDYAQVYKVAGGGSWGSVVAFTQFDAGFAAPYKNLVLKIKDVSDNKFKIKFAGGGSDAEKEFDVTTDGKPVAGKTGWYQMVIPIASNFTGASGNVEFAIFSSGDDTFYFTELGFTGDATGNGLTGDTVADGMLTFYRSGSAVTNIRDLVGENLIEPASLDNLYGTSSAATTALDGMGFNYNSTTNTLTKK